MVKLFICPADPPLPLPSSSYGATSSKKRSRDTDDSTKSSFRGGEGRRKIDKKDDENELGSIMKSIREFSATTYQGQARLQHKNDKLTSLGAPKAKQQTMPLKMALGIAAGREKRRKKAVTRAQESGVVLAKSSSTQHKNPRKGSSNSSSIDDGFDVKTRGGVYHLNSQKLPPRLLCSGRAREHSKRHRR